MARKSLCETQMDPGLVQGRNQVRGRTRRALREREAWAAVPDPVRILVGIQRERVNSESVSRIYPAAGRDLPVDGGDSARRICGLHAIAHLGAARSGLPDHSGGDILSRGESRRDGVGSNGSAGKTVWPGAGAEPDDVHQCGRQVDYSFAIFAATEYRRGRTRSAGRDQCFAVVLAGGLARPAALQQNESRRYADPDAGPDFENDSAVAN